MSSGFGDKVQAVSGATRNLTGHWKSNCHQVETVECILNSLTVGNILKLLKQLERVETCEYIFNS
jgi:hypothetical protein